MRVETKLPKVGTTIFTVMSQLAAQHGAVNLGQGFPDFPVPARLVEALTRAMQAGHNQYSMMTGIPALRAPAAGAPQTGDAELGKTIFWGKGGCNECHSVLGKGGKIGPDLSDAGGSRSTAVLRMAIEDPGANGSKGFEKARVVLKNGQALEGVLKNRNNYSLQLLDARGELHLLLMTAVKEMTVSKNSAMPANYKSRLSAKEIDALVAYLAKQTARPMVAGN